MKAVGLDLLVTNILNDDNQAIMTILVGRQTSLDERLKIVEFIVEEIKKGIEKQKELEEQASQEKIVPKEEVKN